jgi:hypothetical protein
MEDVVYLGIWKPGTLLRYFNVEFNGALIVYNYI